METPRFGLELHSLITKSGELKLSIDRVAIPVPGPDEVVVQIMAAPIHPSDIGLLLGPADISTAHLAGEGQHAVTTATIPEAKMPSMKLRLDQSLPVGNEGAGMVVEAGSSAEAQALMGRAVAAVGGAMYAQYRCIKAAACLVLPPDATPKDGASSLVNPLTALSMIEVMKGEGHKALVHTAAASSLGQILNRICIKDGIGLVNIVRSAEQKTLLTGMGAPYVCDSTTPTFLEELTDAIAATGATLAFDAVGGGKLAGQILGCMEAASNRTAQSYSRYGSTVHKQVYIYGSLDPGPTELVRSFGMAWGVGGWLVLPFLQKAGPAVGKAMQARITAELKTTFLSSYAREISLFDAIRPEIIQSYSRKSTGEKFLIDPSKDAPS